VHNPLQVFVKVTEQDTALTLEKKWHLIILSPHSSYSIKAKKDCRDDQFSVCERQPVES